MTGAEEKPAALIVVQARMGSSRLPGKVLLPVLGRPLLAYLMDRLAAVRAMLPVQDIVVATTTGTADDAIVRWCEECHIPSWRGPKTDVLGRFAGVARAFDAASIVRVTADCPILDPEIVVRAIRYFDRGGFDYVSTDLAPKFPVGMGVEVMTRAALDEAAEAATDDWDREHVTTWIKSAGRHRLGDLPGDRDLSRYRVTVDTEEDLEVVTRVISRLWPRDSLFGLADVIDLLDRNPSWQALNGHVRQVARPSLAASGAS